jgi:hypothetical protein
MLEDHIEGKDPWKSFKKAVKKHGKMFKEEIEEFGDLPHQIEVLMQGYFNYYKPDPLKYIKHKGKKRSKSSVIFLIRLKSLCKGTSITINRILSSTLSTRERRVSGSLRLISLPAQALPSRVDSTLLPVQRISVSG